MPKYGCFLIFLQIYLATVLVLRAACYASPLQIPQRRPGGLAAGVAADHAATLFPEPLAFDLVGGRSVLSHAPSHADAPAVAAEELPVRQPGG